MVFVPFAYERNVCPFLFAFMARGIECGCEMFDKATCRDDKDGGCGDSGLRYRPCQCFVGKVFDQAEDFSCCRVEEGLESFEARDVEYPKGKCEDFWDDKRIENAEFPVRGHEKWHNAFVRVRSLDCRRLLCVFVSGVAAISKPSSFADALGGRKVSFFGWPVSLVRCKLWIASFKMDSGRAAIGLP